LNVINLGAGSSTALTLQANDGDPKYYGVISGNGSLNVDTATPGTTSGQLDLENANTYSGNTTIGQDALIVAGNNNALSSGSVTVNPGGVLGLDNGITIGNNVTIVNNGTTGGSIGGYGTLSTATADPILIQGGAGIVGGRGTYGSGTSGGMLPVVGNLTLAGNTSLTFGGGGGMEFSLMDASGASGTALSWSTISTPNLNITASPSTPFTVELVGIALNQQTIGSAGVFNSALTYNWTFLTSSSPITGFTGSNQFTVYVNSAQLFANPLNGGTFSVLDSGNSLVLNFTPVPEPSTWALMIGGICILAGVAVRRRRRA
jgi:hypothetical protein